MLESVPTVELNGRIRMPLLGLGTWQLTGETCVNAIKMGLELGYRHIDTARIYGNEEFVGKGIEGFERKDLFITSKVWRDSLHFDGVLRSCHKSLELLGTDYLDLYLIHWPNWPRGKVPVKETLEGLKYLKEDGLIRAFGVSNFSIKRMKEALKYSDEIVTNQVEFHPMLYQKELLEFCEENGVKITAYSPVARGAVFKNKTIQEIAEGVGKTPAQVSLKWLLQKGMIVIPKASSKGHLQENLDVFGWRLGKEDVAAIDNLKEKKRMVNIPFFEF